MGPKFWELIIVLAIVILLFGPSRLAGLGGAVGKAMREFKDATKPEEPKAPSSSATADRPGSAGTKA
jgi:sec-independent protein translocase protein TatA